MGMIKVKHEGQWKDIPFATVSKGVLDDAPTDSKSYARKDNKWAEVPEKEYLDQKIKFQDDKMNIVDKKVIVEDNHTSTDNDNKVIVDMSDTYFDGTICPDAPDQNTYLRKKNGWIKGHDAAYIDNKLADITANFSRTNSRIDDLDKTKQDNITNSEDIITDGTKLKIANRKAVVINQGQENEEVKSLGYKVLRPDLSFASQVTEPNTIYEIRDNFDLGGLTIDIPPGCTLKFSGGSLGNGTLNGDNTTIDAKPVKIFNNVIISGNWNCIGKIEWFAKKSKFNIINKTYNLINQTKEIQDALDSSFETIKFESGIFYINKTLTIKKAKHLILEGGRNSNYLLQKCDSIINTTVLATDQNICMIRYSMEQDKGFSKCISIIGGNIDCSLCNNYQASCIEVLLDNEASKLWGIKFNVNLFGSFNGGKAPEGCGIKIYSTISTGAKDERYASMIRFNGQISNFGIGIDINSKSYAWITDIISNVEINKCTQAYNSNSAINIGGSIQPGYFFTEETKYNIPLINLQSQKNVISAFVWDINQKSEDKRTNYYALNIDKNVQDVILEGTAKNYGIKHEYIKGNLYALLKNEYTNFRQLGNKFEVIPNELYNELSAFTYRYPDKEINVEFVTKDSRTQIDCNKKDLFLPEASVDLDLKNIPTENDYVEITINTNNRGYVYAGCYVAIASLINKSYFETFEIEFIFDKIYDGKKSIIKKYTLPNQTTSSKTIFLGFENEIIYPQNCLKFRFKGIKTQHLYIGGICANIVDYLARNTPSYLRGIGNKAFEQIDFVNNIKLKGLPFSFESGSLNLNNTLFNLQNQFYFDSGIKISDKYITTYSLLKFKTPINNPKSIGLLFLINASKSTNLYNALYKLNLSGYVGNEKVTIENIKGNYNFNFSIYKNNKVDNEYILFIDFKEQEFYNVQVSVLGTEFYEILNVTKESISETYTLINKPILLNHNGLTAQRPKLSTIDDGFQYYDMNLHLPIWWNGSKWIKYDGTDADTPKVEYQEKLVSGKNIKTINGETLLGSTDIVIPPKP